MKSEKENGPLTRMNPHTHTHPSIHRSSVSEAAHAVAALEEELKKEQTEYEKEVGEPTATQRDTHAFSLSLSLCVCVWCVSDKRRHD